MSIRRRERLRHTDVQADDGRRTPGIQRATARAAPAIDAAEAFLLAVFLRRYVTYCARRRRFAAMNGAVALFRDLSRR
jgi:hypothetical protein